MLTSADWHIVGCSHGLSAGNNDDRSAGGLRSFRGGSRLDGGGRAGSGEGRDGDSHGVFSWGAMLVIFCQRSLERCVLTLATYVATSRNIVEATSDIMDACCEDVSSGTRFGSIQQ